MAVSSLETRVKCSGTMVVLFLETRVKWSGTMAVLFLETRVKCSGTMAVLSLETKVKCSGTIQVEPSAPTHVVMFTSLVLSKGAELCLLARGQLPAAEDLIVQPFKYPAYFICPTNCPRLKF